MLRFLTRTGIYHLTKHRNMSSSSSTTLTPIPVTLQQISLHSSSINNSLLNSVGRDRKHCKFIPHSKKDDKY
ncbi:unnamed protein product [Schistosoma haematobium]|uniref:Uncharacterized protein n=1 Tax=Schistosoma haematobium TaxID=6185 RepID=A0A095A380_SCHHA|nr:unnamed protein product [Schistosoma haematobium]